MVEREAKDSQQRVDRVLKNLNISPSRKLKDRLVLLDRFTPTLEDEARAIGYASRIFKHAESVGHPFAKWEKTAIEVGTLFTDIGKSGPADATPEQSHLMVSIYAVENITPAETQASMESFLFKYFAGKDPQTKAEMLRSIGINPQNVTMRQFYNMHTAWTYDILDESNISKNIVLTASTHHRLRGDNPHNILDEDDKYMRSIALRRYYGKAEKLVGLLDQYDAFRRRSGLTHEQAVEKVKDLVKTARNGKYANDPEFAQLIGDIEASLQTA